MMKALVAQKERLLEEVRDILARDLGLMAVDVTTDCDLLKDLGLDSLDIADLIFRLEIRFNIRIKDEDTIGMRTVGHIIDYLQKIGSIQISGLATGHQN